MARGGPLATEPDRLCEQSSVGVGDLSGSLRPQWQGSGWAGRAGGASLRRPEPAILGTLAAAYAEARRFPEAVQSARKALELATQQNKQHW